MSAGSSHHADAAAASSQRRAVLLLLLFVACAVPRIAMAIRLDTISSDGAFFIQEAREIEAGVRTEAREKYDLNIYPLVLARFHQAGWNWETAAEIWGVLCASLTVLPLYGWVRRQFNHRLAVLSCILYAFHPKLIEWTPEVLRESTFWLLFTTALYLLWRATSEARPHWYLLAGITTTLAIHTRFEGWFLVIPAVGWTLARWVSQARPRWKLAGGVGMYAVGYPLTMMALTLAFGYSRWEWGAFHRVEMAVRWMFPDAEDVEIGEAQANLEQMNSAAGLAVAASQQQEAAGLPIDRASAGTATGATGEIAAGAPELTTPSAPAAEPMTLARAAGTVLKTSARGFNYGYLVLAAAGFVAGGRRWLRGDYLPLLLVTAVTMAAISVHVWGAYLASSRYVLALVIITTPIAASGMVALCTWLAEGVRRSDGVVRAKAARETSRRALRLALAVFAAVGTIDAVTSSDQGREAKAAMGNWIRRELGQGAAVAGSWTWTLSAYYADAHYQTLPDCPYSPSHPDLQALVESMQAEVVMVSPKWESRREFVAHALQKGYEEVPVTRLPKICRGKVIVLARRHSELVQAEPVKRH